MIFQLKKIHAVPVICCEVGGKKDIPLHEALPNVGLGTGQCVYLCLYQQKGCFRDSNPVTWSIEEQLYLGHGSPPSLWRKMVNL